MSRKIKLFILMQLRMQDQVYVYFYLKPFVPGDLLMNIILLCNTFENIFRIEVITFCEIFEGQLGLGSYLHSTSKTEYVKGTCW